MLEDGGGQFIRSDMQRKFFMMVPSFVRFLGLTPLERTLYEHYVGVCGDGGDECYETVVTTADYCDMSVSSVRRSRQSLAEAYGLINVYIPEKPRNVGKVVPHVVLPDLWDLNIDFLNMLRSMSVSGIRRVPEIRLILKDWLRFRMGAPRVVGSLFNPIFYEEADGCLKVKGRCASQTGVSHRQGCLTDTPRGVSQIALRGVSQIANEDPLYKEDPYIKKILSGGGDAFSFLPFGQSDERSGSSSRIACEAFSSATGTGCDPWANGGEVGAGEFERMSVLLDELMDMSFGYGTWNDWGYYKSQLDIYQFRMLLDWLYKAFVRSDAYADMGVGFFKAMLLDGQRAQLSPAERERLEGFLITGDRSNLFNRWN